MANSKNTIQNIPLEAPLCMNTLKTDVKQFNGYNEKNSTVFGGTLSPIYDKTTELFDKNKSYTFFNSKGVPYTLVPFEDFGRRVNLHLYKNNDYIYNFGPACIRKTERLDVPSNSILATKCPDDSVLYVSSAGSIVKSGNTVGSHGGTVLTSRCWFQDSYIVVITVGESNVKVFRIDDNDNVVSATFEMSLGTSPFISGVRDYSSSPLTISLISSEYFIEDTGIIRGEVYNAGINAQKIEVSFSSDSITKSATDVVYIENFDSGKTSSLAFTDRTIYGANFQQFSFRCLQETLGGHKVLVNRLGGAGDGTVGYTGNNGYDVGCPLGKRFSTSSIYYQDGALISIGNGGLPIDTCLSYGSNIVTRNFDNENRLISYRKNDGNWYCYSSRKITTPLPSVESFKQFVLDNRYVIVSGDVVDRAIIYDIETDEVRPETKLDWIISTPPVRWGEHQDTLEGFTSAVFGGGVNAGYMINNSPFVGYLPNPFVLENFPEKGDPIKMESGPCVQNYCSIGDTVQSAKYFGKDPQYIGTIYPIDPNGNVVLPVSQNAELIKGYSNNDLVKEGNIVYPLMYYNNTQKTYTYMLLSGMENITNAFSLQGQQYTVDDNSIYTVSFNAGVIQNITPVAYKKNLKFLGTLPTQAVFWSDFNKTFYAFTGDRILSRMFEASDINEIYYVGQNPATLSLWICTDDGIYVLSEKDMFKLNYNSKQVNFYSKSALILTEGTTNNEYHTISLYLNNGEAGEMIPLKLETAYYGLGSELKAVMDCWYLRLFDENNTKGYVKAKIHTITDVTRHTEEKTFEVNPSDYDENHIVYLRFQPKYQECVAMQLELETNLGIYQISLGVNATDAVAQQSKFNF